MLLDGATIIDVGGQSTRPNAELIDENIEMQRVMPIIKSIVKKFPKAIISIDTFYSSVAKAAIAEGATIINDVSAASVDSKIVNIAIEHKAPYVLMHQQGIPNKTIDYTYNDIKQNVYSFFDHAINDLKKNGLHDVIIDLGFGFGKNATQNFDLLNNLDLFSSLNKLIMVGVSRKSMIFKSLNITADESLNGTTVLNTIALIKGANILRVHDVKDAYQAIELVSKLTL
jgi:dihydropteroate synthase